MGVDVSKIFFKSTKKVDISKYFEQFDGSNDAFVEIKRLDSYKVKALNNMSTKRFDTQIYFIAQGKIEDLYFEKGIDTKEFAVAVKGKSDKQLQKEIKQKDRDLQKITKEIMSEITEEEIKKSIEVEKEIDLVYLTESIYNHNLDDDGNKIELDSAFWENIGKLTYKIDDKDSMTLKDFVLIEIINLNNNISLGELKGK